MTFRNLFRATAAACLLPLTFASQAMASSLWISTYDQGSYVNLRRGPSTGFRIAGRLTNAAQVESLKQQLAQDGFTWYQVDTGSTIGWVRGDFVSPVGPISPRANESCGSSLAQIQQRLMAVPEAELVLSEPNVHQYSDGPISRNQVHEFRVTGRGGDNIMNSGVMQTQMAAQVIQNCPGIGLVRFSLSETDWREDYGLLHDGMVKAFRCREAGAEVSPISSQWGERVCI